MALPPDEDGKVLDWAHQLADLAGGRTVQWSDSWTDEDLAEATAAAARRTHACRVHTFVNALEPPAPPMRYASIVSVGPAVEIK